MNVTIAPAPLAGTVAAVASKSDAHRLLICAAFADRATEIGLSASSRDIGATVRCLEALGAKIERMQDGLRVTPVQGAVSDPVLDCGESGSTLRFLLPVAAAVSETPVFCGTGRLPARPVSPLLDALAQRGKLVRSERFPIRLAGKLTPGSFSIPGNISSQFVSGLLLAAPLTGGACALNLTSPLASADYAAMTLSVMRHFSVPVEDTPRGFAVEPRAYRSPGRADAEGDWSSAAFWLAAAALGGEISVTGLPENSLQPDRRILELLQAYGARLDARGGTLLCRAGEHRAFDFNTDASPDLAPVLCVLAAAAAGRSRIRGIARLRGKESNRVAACTALVRALGGEIEVQNESFVIEGKPTLSGGTVDAMGDHRIAMAAAAASTACTGPLRIIGAQAAEKSYPRFFKDFETLGGSINVEGKDDSHERH